MSELTCKTHISAPSGISVWWITADQWNGLETVLSAAELQRARRFHLEQDRRRFVATRSALRHLLADNVDGDPASLVFEIGEYGKPSLCGYPDVHFSLTHSEDLIGMAVSREGAVGLDCERIQPEIDLVSLCEQICSRDELQTIYRQGSERAVELFFQVWTRKEAILKALGLGLSFPPNDLTVLSYSAVTQLQVEVKGHGMWWVSTLDAPPGYAAACCAPFRIDHPEVQRFGSR